MCEEVDAAAAEVEETGPVEETALSMRRSTRDAGGGGGLLIQSSSVGGEDGYGCGVAEEERARYRKGGRGGRGWVEGRNEGEQN